MHIELTDIVTENLDSLGESITTAVVLSWSKEPGDSVKEDDVVAVVETDKVNYRVSRVLWGILLLWRCSVLYLC